MAELLLELHSEEIPARMQARAIDDLRRLVAERLSAAQLAHEAIRGFVTPRRLAIVVDGLPEAQPDLSEERKGPRVGAPEQALAGFLKSAGLKSVDQCEVRATDKGDFYFAVLHRAGRPAADVLPGLLREAILALPWPKSMRFPAAPFRWVRPLRSVVCLLDGRVLPLELGRIPVGNATQGHRFLSKGPLEVRGFGDYAEKLRTAYVVLDQGQRREKIHRDLELAAQGEGVAVKDDPALLDEVTGLVEFPVVLTGAIDAAFMDVPAEVLTTSMRTHQKYFACLKPDGTLAPRFLVVANMLTGDGGKAIVAGNERVLRARLSDAKFFWDQDRKARLESRVPKLAERIFHAKLGSVLDKVRRIEALVEAIVPHVPGADAALAKRTALLAKADLSTGMVGEFPELQGVMGRYYALHDREPPEVADAVAEHYSPLGPNDRCPTAPASVIVALADKIDTLVGFWLINEKPTGSKDPFALRRSALGVIRLILENKLRIGLSEVLLAAHAQYLFQWSAYYQLFKFDGEPPTDQLITAFPIEISDHDRDAPFFVIFGKPRSELDDEIATLGFEDSPKPVPTIAQLSGELLDFFADRLKVHLREQGVRHDLIAAVFAPRSVAAFPLAQAGEGDMAEDDLVRLLARVAALDEFLRTEDGANLLVAYRRASNIVRIEEKKDGRSHDGAPDAALFRQDEEKALAERLAEVARLAEAALHKEEFGVAMSALARLRRPVDEFFDRVTVNADETELRANRLRLLSQIRATLNRVADFSKIEG